MEIPQNTLEYWPPIKRILFCFSAVFIVTFIAIKNNGAYSFLGMLTHPLLSLFKVIIPWFAENILHYQYDYTIFTNGSGDTSYDWVSLLIIFLFAVLSTLIWSIIDRRKINYNTSYYWLTVLIRYYIAFMLINYGVTKLIHAQMLPPTLNRLTQPLGEFSPMGLAWTFLGYSKGYNIFMGIVEVLAGFLLFRRTVVLGALITTAISINIMTINYFFDVPVKMISTALFLFSLFLLLPYRHAFYLFLLAGKSSQLPRPYLIPYKPARRLWIRNIKILVIAQFIVPVLFSIPKTQKLIAQYQKRSPLHGIYQISEAKPDQTSIPKDWSLIIFEFENNASIRDRYYNKIHKQYSIDTSKRTLSINNYTFNYSKQNNGDIVLNKQINSRIEEVRLTKINHEEFELINKKFNWIQEYPYNR